MKKLLFSIFTLSIFTLVGFSLYYFFDEKYFTMVKNKSIAAYPQEYLKNFHVINFDQNGSIKNKLYATNWINHKSQQLSKLDKPRLIIYKDNKSIYNISAEKAIVFHKTKEISKINNIELINNVIIINKNNINNINKLTLFTEKLYIKNKNQSFSTDKFVTIEQHIGQENCQTTGIGMQGSLDKNLIQVLDKVTTLNNNLKIKANQVIFDFNTKTATYTGNIICTKENKKLLSDYLQIVQNNDNNIKYLITKGKPAMFNATNIKIKKAQANTIKYFLKEDKIDLIGNAKIFDQTNIIKGDFITYFIKKDLLTTKGNNNKNIPATFIFEEKNGKQL